MRIATGLVLALLLSPAAAQDYRLPPSMKGRPEATKPDIDYRIPGTARPAEAARSPSLKIHNLRCAAGHIRSHASGEVENLSKETLDRVEVTVTFRTSRGSVGHPPVALKPMPMKPGARVWFDSNGVGFDGSGDCHVAVWSK